MELRTVDKTTGLVPTMVVVKAWELRHGRIPEHAFVALRTDWSKRWPDDAALQNVDAAGVAYYPGWSKEVLQLLI
jgi:kynurenine formamidase